MYTHDAAPQARAPSSAYASSCGRLLGGGLRRIRPVGAASGLSFYGTSSKRPGAALISFSRRRERISGIEPLGGRQLEETISRIRHSARSVAVGRSAVRRSHTGQPRSPEWRGLRRCPRASGARPPFAWHPPHAALDEAWGACARDIAPARAGGVRVSPKLWARPCAPRLPPPPQQSVTDPPALALKGWHVPCLTRGFRVCVWSGRPSRQLRVERWQRSVVVVRPPKGE